MVHDTTAPDDPIPVERLHGQTFISILLGVSSLQRLVEIAQSSEKEWSEEQWFKITERLFNRNANIIIVSALMVTASAA